MKRFIRRCLAAGLAAAGMAALAAPSVTFNVPAGVAQGAVFQIVLRGNGFGQTQGGQVIDNVTGGQKFNLQFDPSRVAVDAVQIDPRWNFATANKPGTVNNTAGTLTGLAFGAFPATTDDDFPIATLTLRALAQGSAQVSITTGEVAARVAGVSGTKIVPQFVSSSLSIAAAPTTEQDVPLPLWALGLLGAGLGGSLWRRARTTA
ncbi:MAG: cohesin domain-containing protein [Betaproteobacteria bacterium]